MVRMVSVAAAVLCCLCFFSCEQSTHHREVFFDSERVTIPLDGDISGEPRFYCVSLEGTRVSFFLVKVNDEMQSFFDACLSCYQKKRGFREDKGLMLCNSCGVKYPVEELRTGIGGCYAIRLPGSVQQGNYIITKEALKAGLKFF